MCTRSGTKLRAVQCGVKIDRRKPDQVREITHGPEREREMVGPYNTYSTLIGLPPFYVFFSLFDSRFFFTGSSEMAEMMTKEEQDRMDDVQSAGANPTLSM